MISKLFSFDSTIILHYFTGMKEKDSKNSENKPKLRLLRLPAELDQAIKERAKKENRSVNGQIIQELSKK